MSTLEERAQADSDDSDRFATSGYGDAIDSFVAQTRALVAVTAERDAARAEVERRTLVTNAMKVSIFNLAADLADRDATIARIQALLGDHDGPLWAVRGVREADIRAALEPSS